MSVKGHWIFVQKISKIFAIWIVHFWQLQPHLFMKKNYGWTPDFIMEIKRLKIIIIIWHMTRKIQPYAFFWTVLTALMAIVKAYAPSEAAGAIKICSSSYGLYMASLGSGERSSASFLKYIEKQAYRKSSNVASRKRNADQMRFVMLLQDC